MGTGPADGVGKEAGDHSQGRAFGMHLALERSVRRTPSECSGHCQFQAVFQQLGGSTTVSERRRAGCLVGEKGGMRAGRVRKCGPWTILVLPEGPRGHRHARPLRDPGYHPGSHRSENGFADYRQLRESAWKGIKMRFPKAKILVLCEPKKAGLPAPASMYARRVPFTSAYLYSWDKAPSEHWKEARDGEKRKS